MDGLSVKFLGLLQPVRVLANKPNVIVSIGAIGIEFDGLLIKVFSFFQSICLFANISEVDMGR